MNIVEFVQAHNITLDILGNHGLQTEVGEGWQHVRYTVRLNYAGRSLTTAWRAGTGLAALGTGAGDAANILDSLVSDAASYTDARSFEEWAEEFGYDTDSRAAEKTYNACGKISRDLTNLLGGDLLLTLMEDIERL